MMTVEERKELTAMNLWKDACLTYLATEGKSERVSSAAIVANAAVDAFYERFSHETKRTEK